MGLGNSLKNARGQVAVLFALIFTFMFVLFAFVVDFGHLIHTKMNLQIAADSAAYAGAAWQARLLNQMGAVNYHMRQDYKEMVMRFQVTHTRHNRNFPRGRQFMDGPDSPPPGDFSPFVCQQAHGYQALRGRQYANDTNLCKNADPSVGGLPPIVVPPVIADFDPFSQAIAKQIQTIAGKAAEECVQAADDNRILVNHLINVFQQRSQFHQNQIQEIENLINQVGQENSNSNHPAIRAAFESARRNLTESNKTGNFQMSILQPEGGNYIGVDPIRANNFAIYFEFQSFGSACVAKPVAIRLQPLLGFEKKPEILTYFGVKLTSKPQMLFMPQSWLDAAFPTLEAYAVAKPFGSRIGPQSQNPNYVKIEGAVSNRSDVNNIINFSTRPFDNIGGGRNTKLLAYYDALHPNNEIGETQGNQTLGWPDAGKSSEQLRAPLQAVRTPTIFDALFFTVFPDPGENINRDYEEAEFASALYPDYLEASDPRNNLIDTRAPASTPYFQNLIGNKGRGWIRVNAETTAPNSGYGNYAQENRSSHSVTGSAFLPGISNRAEEFGFAIKEVVHSAWTPPDSPGRIGYGVKYIGLDTLTKRIESRTTAGEQTEIINKPSFDPNISRILH